MEENILEKSKPCFNFVVEKLILEEYKKNLPSKQKDVEKELYELLRKESKCLEVSDLVSGEYESIEALFFIRDTYESNILCNKSEEVFIFRDKGTHTKPFLFGEIGALVCISNNLFFTPFDEEKISLLPEAEKNSLILRVHVQCLGACILEDKHPVLCFNIIVPDEMRNFLKLPEDFCWVPILEILNQKTCTETVNILKSKFKITRSVKDE